MTFLGSCAPNAVNYVVSPGHVPSSAHTQNLISSCGCAPNAVKYAVSPSHSSNFTHSHTHTLTLLGIVLSMMSTTLLTLVTFQATHTHAHTHSTHTHTHTLIPSCSCVPNAVNYTVGPGHVMVVRASQRIQKVRLTHTTHTHISLNEYEHHNTYNLKDV